jgi:hypothetical protein
MDGVDGAAGDGTVGSDGKDWDLKEFSESVAYIGLGMVCFPVSDNCTGWGVDCFPVFGDCTGWGIDCFPVFGDCIGWGVDCFVGSGDVAGREPF